MRINMILGSFLLYIGIILLNGIISCIFKDNKKTPIFVSLFSFLLLIFLLIKWNLIAYVPVVKLFKWQLPSANMNIGIDYVSAFFILPLLIVVISCSLFGYEYNKNNYDRTHWLFFSVMTCSMILVLMARNAILFLVSWEIMSLSSFLLVINDKENSKNIEAGIIYFITAHIGSAFTLFHWVI